MAALGHRLLATLAGPLTGFIIGGGLSLAAHGLPAGEARSCLLAASRPNLAVVYCTVVEGRVIWGFNLSAYECSVLTSSCPRVGSNG